MDKIRINLYDLLACISNAQDLVSPKISNHQQQVAYLTFHLSEHMHIPMEQKRDVFLAALIHDIGALSTIEKLELVEGEPLNINNHAFNGTKLLEGFKPLKHAASIIKFHHISWNKGEGNSFMGEDVPFASHIIHLADRTCALIDFNKNILMQVPHMLDKILKQSNTKFEPNSVDALFELSTKEHIWLDLASRDPREMVPDSGLSKILTLEINDVIDLSFVFSRIIDFRSKFTARHSAGVAKTAEKLANLVGFSPYECKMMLIAGYLHDLGKLAISDDILEKPDKLTKDEFSVMRSHTYYTYRLLEPIKQLKTINTWASYHHEKINGNGYPFHISGDSLSLGSRIMAVADVFTAITEDRPYRKGMDSVKAKRILLSMVESNALDANVVSLLVDNFKEINIVRETAQIEAAESYKVFLQPLF